ncbi:MAG: hypothetical protein FWF78_09510 [Defluviitaleaceae bacterium]|nr:hypothetical protein [Defluviitaleaceae bacterium]
MLSLIKYNLKYYEKSFKYIVPCLFYMVFLGINYQITSPIWSTYFIAAVGTFVFAVFIATSLMTCEDATQQWITRLHLRNDKKFYFTKIISIQTIMIPICIIVVAYPLAIGFFVRSLTITEIIVAFIFHLMLSLLGTAVGIFFTTDSFLQQALVVLFSVLPLAAMFDNVLIIVASYLLPPINFLAEKMHYFSDEIFVPSFDFLLFILYALGYSFLLMSLFIIIKTWRAK